MTAIQAMTGATSAPATPPGRSDRLLDIDPVRFRSGFDQHPFLIRHRLADHPLFALPRLIKLARALPSQQIEYNAGDIPVGIDPALTPQTGLTAEETLRRIAECGSWMALKYVEHDPEYRALLEHCLGEVKPLSEPIRSGMRDLQGFIFVSSPGSVTPYHMDPEHNFLLQIRGSKHVALFDGRDRSILSEPVLERFHGGSHRNLEFREEYDAKALRFTLEPGMGLHFPATAPHYIRNGPEVSISFSITFRTPDLDARARVHRFNSWLRSRGMTPSPRGHSPLRDSMKSLAWRVARRARLVK